MFGSLRRHVSYANVVATMALVFAMGGTAIASRHYLITSTKQFKPSVLTSLKGRSGATGPAGKEGPSGKEGPAGKVGEPGPLLAALPPGKTENGAFGLAGYKATGFSTGVVTSYPIPLGFTPTVNVVKAGAASTAACPGSVGAPTATAGNLCIYAEHETGELLVKNEEAALTHFGFLSFSQVGSGEPYFDLGTWAVTAP